MLQLQSMEFHWTHEANFCFFFFFLPPPDHSASRQGDLETFRAGATQICRQFCAREVNPDLNPSGWPVINK
jgi:hypothetical protein